MNALAPLLGVLVLSTVLVLNFFRAAWQLGILRAFGRRHCLHWRTITAGALAATLPPAGALIAMLLIPVGNQVGGGSSAALLAMELALSGMFLHLITDQIVRWGRVSPR